MHKIDIYGNKIPEYIGVTHLARYKWILRFWRLFLCKRKIHCFDEVLSSGGFTDRNGEKQGWSHYLVCDACGLMYEDGIWNKKYVK